tara:strand:- start:492 stop:833 length:342 start_codon:yes stop_codon:yes gene_type:complete
MNIYKVTRNEPIEYDTFDSFVVVAPDEATARRTHPATSADLTWDDCYGQAPGCWRNFEGQPEHDGDNGWTDDIKALTVTPLGKTDEFNGYLDKDNLPAEGIKPGVVLASFNAG